jgi:DNA-binding CsgD family transcriptional regulator
MQSTTRVTIAREALSKLSDGALEPQELLHEAAAQVRRAVPSDHDGWLMLDPDTLIPTGQDLPGVRPEQRWELLRDEVLTPELHGLRDVSRRPRAVASLCADAQAGAGDDAPDASHARRPASGDEVRMVFRTNGSAWGAACLLRDGGARGFDAQEGRFLAEAAAEVGHGLRRSLARRVVMSEAPTMRGMLVLDDDLRVVTATDQADRWMARMAPESQVAVRGVALRAQAGDAEAARARVRLRDGEWLLLHGADLETGPDGQPRTAVMLEPARGAELTSLLLRLYGLSEREREVTELLLRGLDTDEVAARLFITRHTLRDHVKAIFAKAAVNSRHELMALLAGSGDIAAAA